MKMFFGNFQEICIFSSFVYFYFTELYSIVEATSNFALIKCINDTDCGSVNGICKDNLCNCDNSFNCKLNAQTLVNQLDEPCQSNSDCNMDSAMCSNESKKCTCMAGFVAGYDKRRCLKTSSRLGDECQENVQCYTKTPSSNCQRNKCACQQHMHEYNGSCYKNVALGESCQLLGECSLIQNADCVNSKCQCHQNYISNGSSCLLKANSINSTCIEDVQCQAQLNLGGECFQGICRCKDIYNYKASTHQCVHDILINEVCTSHSDCHQPGTGPSRLECILGVCKCKSPFSEESGFCINSSTSMVVFKSIMLFLGTIFLIK